MGKLNVLNEKSRSSIINKSIHLSFKIIQDDRKYNKDVFNIKSIRENERCVFTDCRITPGDAAQ